MYWFTKFCCMCLTTNTKHGFCKLDTECRDKIKLFDKMTISLSEEFQDILRHKVPDAAVCRVCKNNIMRNYSSHVKIVNSLNKIKGYIEKLTYKKDTINIESHNDHKNKEVKLSVPENTVEHQEEISINTNNDFVKPFDNFAEPVKNEFKSEIEHPHIKIEPLDYKEDIIMKEEFNIENIRTSSPIDVKTILAEYGEDDFNNTTIPLSESVFNLECQLNESNNCEISDNSPQKYVEINATQSSYLCTFCTREFNSTNILFTHLTTEHNCSFSDRSFKSQVVLNRHVSIHSDTTPIVCAKSYSIGM